MKKTFLLTAVALCHLFCASGQQYHINEVTKIAKVVSINADEVTDKSERGKYDIRVYIQNLSDDSVLLFLAEIQCFKGKVQGRIGHAFFGAGERAIDLKLNQKKDFRFVCNFDQPLAAGPYRLVFQRIFSNPSNDGKTTGKLLAKDVELKVMGKS